MDDVHGVRAGHGAAGDGGRAGLLGAARARTYLTFGARTSRRALLVSLLVLAVLLVAPAAVLAKSYSMPRVEVAGVVAGDGSLSVIESRSFDFSGDYSRVYWYLEKSGREIEVQGVGGPDGKFALTTDPSAGESRPPGTYRVTDEGSRVLVEAFHRSADTQATFALRYVVRGAAQRYSDTSELYWKFVGDQWELPTGEVSVKLILPPGVTREQVRAWAHGPLTGVVTIEPDASVSLSVSGLPAQTFVEGRVLFPAEALPKAASIAAAREQEVLVEEGRWADEANAKRAAARRTVAAATGAGVALPLLGLAIVAGLFLRFGKEHKSDFPGGYLREDPAPETHPALVGALWRFGKVGDPEVAATFMDLADRGVISMRPISVTHQGLFGAKEEQTYELTLDASRWGELHILDQELLSLVFTTIAGSSVLTLAQLKAEAKASPQVFASGMQKWRARVVEEASARGWFESAGAYAQAGAWLLAVAVAVSTVFAVAIAESGLPALVGLPCVVAMGVAATRMSRRSREANDLFARYKGVHDYLRDFSRLSEAPPGHVKLWERFLVLAVVFGIAEQVIEAMRVRIPEVVEDPAFHTVYWWAYAGQGHSSPVGALSTGFASAAAVARSEMSSSSGGGGGFSGGGGGGGGGAD